MEIAKNIKSALSTITGQLSQLKEELVNTNRQIGITTVQIQELKDMPVSFDDYGVFLKTKIDQIANKHLQTLEWQLLRDAPLLGCCPANKMKLEALDANFFFPTGMFSNDGEALTINAACFFFGEQIHESFMTRIKPIISKSWGNEELPKVTERRKKIAELTQQREALLLTRTTLEGQINEIAGVLSN